jgi:hypothetical protein
MTRATFLGARSFYFRDACAYHNATHGRFLSWVDARALWRHAHAAALNYCALRA